VEATAENRARIVIETAKNANEGTDGRSFFAIGAKIA
jgi:hypothetical protein